MNWEVKHRRNIVPTWVVVVVSYVSLKNHVRRFHFERTRANE